jgi:hypothetical protein
VTEQQATWIQCDARTDVFGRCKLASGHRGDHSNALGEDFRVVAADQRDIKAEAEAMAQRLRILIANPAFADTRPVLEIRLDTIETLLRGPETREQEQP